MRSNYNPALHCNQLDEHRAAANIVAAARLALYMVTVLDCRRRLHGAEVVNKVVQGINQLHTQALGLKTGMASLGDQAQSIGQIMIRITCEKSVLRPVLSVSVA